MDNFMPTETLDTKVRKYADELIAALFPPNSPHAPGNPVSQHQVAVEGIVRKILVDERDHYGAIIDDLESDIEELRDQIEDT